jgi:lipopolysaccharide/colanic/teichoic acid biosynthesis glycosyltransferase
MHRAARVLMILGTVSAVVALGLIHAGLHDYRYTGTFRFGWALAYIGVLLLSAYAVGFPDLVRGRSALVSAVEAVAIAAVGMSLLQLIVGSALLPRLVVFGAAGVLIPVLVLTATMASKARAGAVERDRVVIVADAVDVQAVRDDLGRAPERDAQVVASIGPEEFGNSDDRQRLVVVVEEARGTVLVLSQAAQTDEGMIAVAADLHARGIRVRTLTAFSAQWLGKLPITELERISLMFDIGELHRAGYARLKRMVDMLVGAIGLLALVLALPVVVLGNIVGNRGALLFRQRRIGRDGTEFEILKLRTMTGTEQGDQGSWTDEHDPRITAFGRVLRRTHLDELPQVVNVLRGDLSVVGPRPEQVHYVEELKKKIPFYDLRHAVRPGLTGWAQVKYPYGSNEGDALEKLQYEFFYLQNQSLGLDLRILRRTLRHVLGFGGR